MAQRGQGAGQGSDDVSETSSLGKWDTFGSDERDIHESGTSSAREVDATQDMMKTARAGVRIELNKRMRTDLSV